MSPLQSLLELQGLDTRIAQLEHRREQVPERDELRLLKQESVALGERLVAAQTLHHELERRQKRYDDDLSSVLAKREQENRLLYSGQVTGIRELQSLEEEVAALGRRQRVVEDKLLEVMEQLEPSVADLEDLQSAGRTYWSEPKGRRSGWQRPRPRSTRRAAGCEPNATAWRRASPRTCWNSTSVSVGRSAVWR